MRHTVIKYLDGHLEIQYGYTAPLHEAIELISHPEISDKEIEEIKTCTIERLYQILNNYF